MTRKMYVENSLILFKIRYADLNTILGLGLADPADVESLKAEAFSDYVGAEIEVGL